MNLLTKEEAERAIYIDFEGPGKSDSDPNPDPILIGMQCEKKYDVVVHEKEFESWANQKKFGFMELSDCAEWLYKRAKTESRHLVYFTQHEPKVLARFGVSIDDVGFDVRIPAKKVFRARFKEFRRDKDEQKAYAAKCKNAKKKKSPKRQKQFDQLTNGLLTLIAKDETGLPRPASYGPSKVGKWISNMRDSSEKKGDFVNWTKSAKKNAALLINHNKHDCLATHHVLMHMIHRL